MSRDLRALRRQVLLERCALQRHDAAETIGSMMVPINPAPGGLLSYLSGNIKVPLTIAGVVLGMVVAKPRRALPILTTGFALFKLVRTGLATLGR